MKVLVTGGAGFIGSNLVEALIRRGNDVTVIDNLSTGSLDNLKDMPVMLNVGNCCPDILSECEPEIIYHLGMPSSSPMYKRNPFLMGDTINATLAVFELAKRCNARVVFTSSSSVYNELAPPHSEDMPIKVTDYYTETRHSVERISELYRHLHGVSSLGLRLFSVYGPRDLAKGTYANVITQFLLQIKDGVSPEIYGDGSQSRDFIYIDDVCNALMLAGNSTCQGIVNVGTGVSYTFLDIIRMINEALGTDVTPTFIENPIGNYVSNTLANTSLVRKLLGFRANITIEDGITKMVEHYVR